MTFLIPIILTIALLPILFLWTAIHEMSHIFMAKSLLDVTEWSVKLYPHIHERDGTKYFVWGLSMWRYDGDTTPAKEAAISLAPRIPDLVAAMMLQAYWLIPYGWWSWVLVAFGVGGLIDLAVGSIGSGDMSDLQRASKSLDISPWILRIAGWIIVLAAGLPIVISLMSKLF